MKDPVKDKLKRFGIYLPLGERAFFPTIEVAVSKYVAAHSPSERIDLDVHPARLCGSGQ